MKTLLSKVSYYSFRTTPPVSPLTDVIRVDVAKKGLKFGDEDEDVDAQDEVAELKELYAPLSAYLMKELDASINEG